MIDDAMTHRGWTPRDVAARSEQYDVRGRGVSHGTVTDFRNGDVGQRGPYKRTLKIVAETLGLDPDAVIEAAHERDAQTERELPDDFNYLTETQWNALQEMARQFRLANERGPIDDINTGASPGVNVGSTDS